MGITEEHLLREMLVDKWGIRFGLFDQLVLIQGPFLRQCQADRQDQECCREGNQITDFAAQIRFCTHISSPNFGPDSDARST